MPIPLFAAIIAGACGGNSRVTAALDVGMAAILNGKAVHGYGYDAGVHIGTTTYGTLTPSTIDSTTVETVAYNSNASPNTWEVWFSGTGYSKADLVSVLAEDGGGSDLMTVDANVSFGDNGSDTYWIWNATDHTLPAWLGDSSSTFTCTFTYIAGRL